MYRWFLCAGCLAACALARVAPVCAEAPPAPQIQIAAVPTADERLFLLRVLEDLYESWPVDVSHPDQFVAAVADHRRDALKFKQHAEASKLDPELATLFGEFVQSLDAYTEFLTSIDQIKADALRQGVTDNFSSGMKGGATAAATFDALKQNDAATGDAMGAALLIGTIEYAFDAWQKADEREQAQQAAVRKRAQMVQDKIHGGLLHAQSVARQLSTKYGWKRGEAGFELSAAQAAQVQKLAAQGDIKALARVLEETADRRPRDPFPRLAHSVCQPLIENSSTPALRQIADKCVEAARLVPAPAVYDEYRLQALVFAALIAQEARSVEIKRGVVPLGSTETGSYAIALWRKVLEFEPADTTAEIREFLFASLLANGELTEAMSLGTTIAPLRSTSADFAYGVACLQSRRQEAQASLDWLRRAIKYGFYDIPHIKRDPDLAHLRSERPKEFADVVDVKAKWDVVFGVFQDDITLTNQSAFPLIDVVLSAHLEQDTRRWDPVLKADRIEPGDTYTWSNVVSIPKSRITKSSATIQCDQMR